ncbi:hypothetical protein ABZ793_09415 [Micromonospora sp. NPDC047465]|uniref:hypothetical protein n=1 Tax=Micromonospora sp. NPDC047465 TaxID=3154813 RepID=UPI0033EABDEA
MAALSTCVETALRDLLGVELAVAVRPVADPAAGVAPTAASAFVSTGGPLRRGATTTVTATADGVSLEVTGAGRLVCDVAAVRTSSPAEWDRSLAEHAALAREAAELAGESHDQAACRTGAVLRCLRRLHLPTYVPLTLAPASRSGWLVYVSGTLRVATHVVPGPREQPVVLAVLTNGWT